MKYYRYMSLKEFEKLAAGVVLKRDSKYFNGKHYKKARTTSHGFCFVGEETEISTSVEKYIYNEETDEDVLYYEDVDEMFSPVDCISFLDGIVTDDVLVEFENISAELEETSGVYADPINVDDWCARVIVDEYCVDSYSRDTMKPVRYALVNGCRDYQWYDFN